MIRPRDSMRGINRDARPVQSRAQVVRLDYNELVPGLPEAVFADIVERVEPWMFSAYPEPLPLYDALAARLSVSTDALVVGAGSDAVIAQTLEVFCGPGDDLVLTTPTYGMYHVYAHRLGCDVTCVEADATLSWDVDAVIAAISPRTKVVAIANPSGAVGTHLGGSEISAVLAAARSHDAVLLLDEAYIDFVEDRWGPQVQDQENLLLVRTFSKAAGLAGLRVGYAVGHADVIRWIRLARPNVEVNQVGIVAARHLLEQPNLLADVVASVCAGRDLLADALRDRGVEVPNSHTNFLLAGIPDGAEVARQLADRGILVRTHPGSDLLEPYVRITAGPPGLMTTVIACLDDIVAW